MIGAGDRADPSPRDAPVSLTKTDWGQAAVLGCAALALFVATLCPTIFVEDSAEFTTVASVLGVAHPPGYPLYVMLAAAFIRIVRVGDLAYRSNLFSAACGALTIGALCLFMRRLRIGRIACLTACTSVAVGSTFWSLSLVAEVHTLNALLLVIMWNAALTADQNPSSRNFAAFGLAIGLLVGHRNLNVLFAAPFVLFLEAARRTRGGQPLPWLYAMVAVLATASLYLYLPLAARGEPIVGASRPSTPRDFYDVVTAAPYFRHFGTGPWHAVWGRIIHFCAQLPSELGFALLATPFGASAWRRRAGIRAPLAFGSMVLGCVSFAALYNVIDIDAYFLPATLGLAIFAAKGMDLSPRRLLVVLPVLALVPVPLHLRSLTLRHVVVAERYGRDLLRSAPPDSVVVTFGDTTRNVMLYQQAVLGDRPDVIVAAGDQLGHAYLAQLRARYPAVDWGETVDGISWMSSLVGQNSTRRSVCLTLPFDLAGDAAWTLRPRGLLYCSEPSAQPPRWEPSVSFWESAFVPQTDQLRGADVHLHMVAMGYATARFRLAEMLAQSGDLEEARRQLRALLASNPDESEAIVARAKETIGQRLARPIRHGARATRALSEGNNRLSFLTALAADSDI
jgi:hypothetical protein